MPTHLDTGQLGEDTAAKHLRRLGYKILERNAFFGRDEIDVIARDTDRDMIVFVEVKTRSTVCDAYPISTAVDRRKRQCLRRAIGRWVVAHGYDGPGRLDVVCVSGRRVVEHLMDVGSDFY